MTTTQPNDKAMRPLLEWLLAQYPDTPKTRAKQWIAAGRVSVNGKIIRLPHQLLSNPAGTLELHDRRATALECGPTGWQIHPRVTLLHIDAALAVVNKGPGLLAVPAQHDDTSALGLLADFLTGALRANTRGAGGRGYSLPPAYRRLHPLPVHRLDQYTSGVFCMAMNPSARQHLIAQLQTRAMRREYVAYVEGRPTQPRGTWRNWLKLRDDEMRQFVITDTEAQLAGDAAVEAITHYEVLTEFPLTGGAGIVSKLRFRLETGCKHQIRAQAAYAGLPLVGDHVYNRKYRENAPQTPRINFPRQALHAAMLSLEHPAPPHERRTWTAALPKDLFKLETLLRTGRI
ncbi:MAG: RluA family pseudouridine synthase [Verrucomicrobia bacterium]|nr:MAG: RluA family pseudouridine synthase [Verrucomicrobiota bacterium]